MLTKSILSKFKKHDTSCLKACCSSAFSIALLVIMFSVSGVNSAVGQEEVRLRKYGLSDYEQVTNGYTIASEDGSLIGLPSGSEAYERIGFGLWATPFYKWTSIRGYETEDFSEGSDSSLGGVTLGADYALSDALSVGLSFNVGTGYTTSVGNITDTHSDFNFWGLGVYSVYSANNFSIMADLGYTESYGETTMEMVAAADAESDMTTGVWTAGLQAEYIFETNALDIIPHVGVIYMNAHTYEYNTTQAGNTILNAEESYQNVWRFPVGVRLQKDFATDSGWLIIPRLNLGFVAAAGDLDSESRVSTPGATSIESLKVQNVDEIAFDGGVGFSVGNEIVTFSLDYNLLASKHETSHMVFANFGLTF